MAILLNLVKISQVRMRLSFMHVICVDKSISLRCPPFSVVAVKFSSNENLEFFLSMGFHFLRGYPPRQPARLVNSGASVRTSEGEVYARL